MEQKELRELEERCIQEQLPACNAACPIHVNVRAMAAEISRGDFTAAAKILKKTLPFPGIISRICDQPCQTACKRQEAGDAISIAALERSCLDWAEDYQEKIPNLPKKERQVAVVGGGLSGLTAAFDLARKGYTAVVYEQERHLGGDLWNFSEKELPREVIEKDLQTLAQIGLEIHLGPRIEKDLSLDKLRQTFDAVYLAPGQDGGEGFGLELDEQGRIKIHPATFTTSLDGVFAGGGVRQKGKKRSHIQSISDGRRAAISIDRYLQKVSLTGGRTDEGSFAARLFTSTEGIGPRSAVPMADAARGYSREAAVEEAKRCIQCQCLECVKVCEYLNSFGSYPKRYVREIYNNLSIVMGQRHANKLINSCSLCGLCKEVCPHDLHMGMVCRQAREEMVKRGKMPPSAHDFPIRDMLFSNSEKCTLARHQPGTESSEYVFFPGCQLNASAPQLVKNVYSTLRQELSGGVGLMLRCCGAPADWSGRVELFRSSLQEFSKQWQQLGKPKLITACSTCYEVFKTHLADVPLVNLYELLDELGIFAKQREGKPAVVAVHDACTTRHESRIQQSVRNILHRLGMQIEELSLSRDKTECCGYGGLMFFANPELAKQAILRRIEESPLDYVVYCAMCRDYLASKGKRTVHLLDLLLGAEDVRTIARRGPGYSQRHDNRVHLKNAFLRELWGESVAAKEGYEKVELMVSDQVRQVMEDRLILVEDLQQVIDFAETTGNKLLDAKTGHFIAHYKPTSVTYWVEYSVQEGRFGVHNAYSHRMEIAEDGK